MAAERKEAGEPQRIEHLTLVALYESEERADELLERLGALSIDTSEATIVRVELSQQQRAVARAPSPSAAPFSRAMRSAVTGAIIGSAPALPIGLVLYEAGFLNLPFIDGLFLHALISTLAGAILGAGVGAFVASGKRAGSQMRAAPELQQAAGEGFLVVIKTPPHLAEQAEAIARRLGAKEIIL